MTTDTNIELPLKEKKAKETKHKEFVENRRKCIKDEFSIVKEALKKIYNFGRR